MTWEEFTDRVQRGEQPATEIHGLSPSLYVVFVIEGAARQPLVDGAGTRQFPSRSAALDALRSAGLARVAFVHRSAYDEMVNLAGGESLNEMRETIDLAAGQSSSART